MLEERNAVLLIERKFMTKIFMEFHIDVSRGQVCNNRELIVT